MRKYVSDYSSLYLDSKSIGKRYNHAINNKFECFISELEKHYLNEIFSNFNYKDGGKLLDFACGTGRIIKYISNNFKFKHYIGCDISPEMINEAKININNNKIEYIIGNIAINPNLIHSNSLDVITSFRLILNLEDENRYILLKELNKKLNENGILIINNHMNRYSILGFIAFLLHKLLKIPLKNDFNAKDKRRIINTMSQKEVEQLLFKTGFKPIKIYHFAFFPGHKNFIMLPHKTLFRIEIIISKIPFLNYFCKDQIYVSVKNE